MEYFNNELSGISFRKNLYFCNRNCDKVCSLK